MGQDSKNDAGSALVLLMLRPHLYGSGEQGWTPWWRLGFPPPSHLLTLDTNPIRSGRGPGNHRANVLEALIDHWRELRSPREVEAWAVLDGFMHLQRRVVGWSPEDVPSWAMLHAMLTLKLQGQLLD